MTGCDSGPYPLSPLPASHVLSRVVSCPILAGARIWLVDVEDASASAARHTAWLQLQCWHWHGMQAVCIPALGACSHQLIPSALALLECIIGHLACETEVSPLKLLQFQCPPGFCAVSGLILLKYIQHNQSAGLTALMPRKLPALRWRGYLMVARHCLSQEQLCVLCQASACSHSPTCLQPGERH